MSNARTVVSCPLPCTKLGVDSIFPRMLEGEIRSRLGVLCLDRSYHEDIEIKFKRVGLTRFYIPDVVHLNYQ